MSKRSRRSTRADAVQPDRSPRSVPTSQIRAASGSGAGAAAGGGGTAAAGAGGRSGRSQSPTGTARAGRRERERQRLTQRSFLDRYRAPLVAVAVVVVVGAFLFAFYQQATARSYTCDTLMTPAPSASPATPGSSASLGQAQPDMGQIHVLQGTTQHYGSCPPASGPHYNASGAGPIAARFYDQNEAIDPEGWIHNLEHGAIVIAYSCTKGTCDDTHIQQLRDLLSGWPASPVCGFPAGSVTPVVVRFDDISTPYAAIVWDRVLLQETLDRAQILAFYQEWGEKTNPERQCASPSPSAGPSASAAASASPSPAAASGSSPAAVASSSPEAAPASSPSPS